MIAPVGIVPAGDFVYDVIQKNDAGSQGHDQVRSDENLFCTAYLQRRQNGLKRWFSAFSSHHESLTNTL
jgi:hypothetical protein